MRWLGFDPETPASTRTVVLGVLVLAVLGISSSAVIVRAMSAAWPALAIAAWRTLGSGLVLAVPGHRHLGTVTRRDALGLLVAGLALGMHFWSWFASVQHTTILRSTLLVALVPAWTALLEWTVLGVRPKPQHGVGVAIALPGLALLAGTEGGDASLLGDLLAIGAGVLWAVYLLLGRSIRQRVPVTTFMGIVCFAACIALFPLAAILGTPMLGFPGETWGLLLLAILGPQLLGHQGFAYAVKWLPATTISAIMLLEPVGATLLAAVVFREIPGPWAIAGSILVLAGIGVATRAR